MQALGDFIDGRWLPPEGEVLVSTNPARAGAPVLETATSRARVALACDAAAAAAPGWARRSLADRMAVLARFRALLSERVEDLAEAITLETGKIRSEARAEVQGLVGRFELVRAQVERDLADRAIPGRPGETLRHHALGVVGVIGPFNFPLHLCHAHIVPALLMGNAVVVKPSEVTPLAAQRYAEVAAAAGLPAGVFNLVQGRGDAGAALIEHRAVRGLCFTGSYRVGRRIQEASLDRPELLVALEMGGKNTVVLLEDADIHQAAHEIALGGYLTTGQRCTATDRVLVHKSRVGALLDALRPLVRSLRFGAPDDPKSFAGPLATAAARERVARALAAAEACGCEPVVPAAPGEWGEDERYFQAPSLHLLPPGTHHVPGYTDEELFGPDLAVDVFADDDEAIAVLDASPYGLANSVFTGDDARFERFYRETFSGILNRNRSTNLASPQLPFGGVGHSGNYRPAGSYAARNVCYPVAVQENVIGWGQIHPQLIDHMPPPDFDRLEAQHAAEERVESARTLLDEPRPMRHNLPRGGHLPQSAGWLRRLYAGERVVEEKKPPVFDHLRSAGPWFVSIDDNPLSVLDGMSQTATSVGGFAESNVVQSFVCGAFGDTLVSSSDTSVEPGDPATELGTVLRHLVPGLPYVTFTSSGAEANEKALALCRQVSARPGAHKVLVFDGCFHGRTLLTLHCTANPAKRKRFELAGYLATFVPFPVWVAPGEEPRAPSGYYAMAGTGDVATLKSRYGDPGDDPLLAAEVEALVAVDAALRSGEHFAVMIEPMQSEGGDRYATTRFFRALRLLTRFHDTPLVFDEVQTGFGLGGDFAWHLHFRLVNLRGQPDYPDAVTFAKRAQVGVVMSRFEDLEPTSSHPASLIRGRMHAEQVSTQHAAERIENLVRPRLDALARGFPHLVGSPRGRGYAFAFDLPSAELLDAFVGQRFWRGAIVFAAGTRTARYRLNEGYLAREIDLLFDAIRRQLAWLDAHPGARPPTWEDPVVHERPRKTIPHRIRTIPGRDAEELLPTMLDIELAVYEPARRTPETDIRAALQDAESIVTIAEVEDGDAWRFAGFAIGWPLERAAAYDEGPDGDPMLGKHNTLYSMSLTVAPEYHDFGLGRLIKVAQLREAAARRSPDGSPRYRYVTGRNRIGHTPRMTHLNWVYGAHTVSVLTGQYEDPEGQAIYYRIPLTPIAPLPREPESSRPAAVPGVRMARNTGPIALPSFDLAQGLARPLARPPASLLEAEQGGLLFGPAVNKLTLMNYVTPAVVRALEWVGALLPRLPHLYLTSGRDECVDKALRVIKYHRSDAQIAIGFAGGYVGHTTAAARSLSDPTTHRGGPPHFAWPRVPHPADVGVEASVAAIRAAIETAGGPARVLGLVFEIVQERSGRVLPDAMWPALAALREELALPLIAIESTTACYRSGLGPLASGAMAIAPDIVAYWGGAQTGYLHVASRWRVAEPLTLVSTWDGDELSLIREHHQLRAARKLDVGRGAAALDKALAAARTAGMPTRGLGLYRVIEAGERAGVMADELRRRGVVVRRFPNGCLGLVPALDQAEDAALRLGAALREIL